MHAVRRRARRATLRLVEIGDKLGEVVLIANAGLQGARGEKKEITRSRFAHGARCAPDHVLRQEDRPRLGGLAADQSNAVGKGIELQGKLGGALIERVEVGGLGTFAHLQSLEDLARFWGENAPIDKTLMQLDAMREAIIRLASERAKPVG